MAKKETTTEALTRMMREQERKANKDRTVTDDGTTVINHPNNKGIIVGEVRGGMTW